MEQLRGVTEDKVSFRLPSVFLSLMLAPPKVPDGGQGL